MPRKKKQETKTQEIPTKVDTQKEVKPMPVQWYQMDQYVGQPVWDSRDKKWRILDGYRRSGNTYSITFSDIADWVSFNDRLLYLEEVKE